MVYTGSGGNYGGPGEGVGGGPGGPGGSGSGGLASGSSGGSSAGAAKSSGSYGTNAGSSAASKGYGGTGPGRGVSSGGPSAAGSSKEGGGSGDTGRYGGGTTGTVGQGFGGTPASHFSHAPAAGGGTSNVSEQHGIAPWAGPSQPHGMAPWAGPTTPQGTPFGGATPRSLRPSLPAISQQRSLFDILKDEERAMELQSVVPRTLETIEPPARLRNIGFATALDQPVPKQGYWNYPLPPHELPETTIPSGWSQPGRPRPAPAPLPPGTPPPAYYQYAPPAYRVNPPQKSWRDMII